MAAPFKKGDGKPTPKQLIAAEIARREDKAKREKQRFNDDIREAYSFVMPQRIKPSVEQTTQERPTDAADNFSSLGEEVCTDFASDMADTFIPEQSQWAAVEVSAIVPDEFKNDAIAAAKLDSDTTFAAITASNFHEVGKQGFKDLAVSAFGMLVQDPGAGMPFRCQVIPIGELLILRDAFGCIGTRFWTRNMSADDIKEIFPDLELPASVLMQLRKRRGDKKFDVTQGCYRDYSKKAEEAWIQFTRIDGDVVQSGRFVGAGSAHILVGRWDPDPNFSWGNGCAIKALPEFRELDETAYLKLKGLARQIDPSVAYDDDSVINLEGGLPNGVAIPRMKGSQIDVIESSHDLQSAMFALGDVEDRIRRHFYQDGPRQEGKTPPTLGQWADESLQKQRRLGTPAAPLWTEFLSEAYMRFRWLLVTNGSLKPEIKVGGKFFPVRPINPLKRAAQQQQAVATERVLATFSSVFGPNLIPLIIDVGETANNLKNLSYADGVKMKSAAEINDAMKQNQQALLAQQVAPVAGQLLKQ